MDHCTARGMPQTVGPVDASPFLWQIPPVRTSVTLLGEPLDPLLWEPVGLSVPQVEFIYETFVKIYVMGGGGLRSGPESLLRKITGSRSLRDVFSFDPLLVPRREDRPVAWLALLLQVLSRETEEPLLIGRDYVQFTLDGRRLGIASGGVYRLSGVKMAVEHRIPSLAALLNTYRGTARQPHQNLNRAFEHMVQYVGREQEQALRLFFAIAVHRRWEQDILQALNLARLPRGKTEPDWDVIVQFDTQPNPLAYLYHNLVPAVMGAKVFQSLFGNPHQRIRLPVRPNRIEVWRHRLEAVKTLYMERGRIRYL